MRLFISQNLLLLSAKFRRSLNILSTAFEILLLPLPLLVPVIDFRLPLNLCACELATDAAAIALSEAANDADFNCFVRLDEWCSEVDDVKFLTTSSLDGVSPVDVTK